MDRYPSSPQARVLVVDDEPLLRMFNVEMLSDAGFDVIEASTGDEALCLLEAGVGVSAVFTDVEMPGRINGFELAALIETRWPQIGVVVTSGRRLPDAAFCARGGRFVPKPYTVAHVVGLIEGLVRAPAMEPCAMAAVA